MQVITRGEARGNNLKRYFTGKPCSNGHVADRFAATGKCTECNRLKCLDRYAKRNPKRRTKVEIKKISEQRKADRTAASAPLIAAATARRDAKLSGSKTYAGRPCKHGHDGLKYTGCGSCVECSRANSTSEEKKQYDALYLTKNKEKILARCRAYYQRTSQVRMVTQKLWNSKNIEKVRAIKKSYKARRRTQEKSGMSTKDLILWEQSTVKVCYWCDSPCEGLYHVDHYFPLSKGGAHREENLVISCPGCNLRKSARDPQVFAAMIGKIEAH